ncbi:MAG: right-handed parallel beta-helix repeat-containing protein, partial [Thermoguttaceae bacterium]|nr:right-handed parallel beta-helix repeat-containing protein [Thermoguttaceae bacterium]
DHVVIRNLIVQGFQLDGIALVNSATNVVIEQCTIRGNARAGMSVGWGSDVKVNRILTCANAFSEVLTLPYSRVKLEKSRLTGDYGKPWVDQSGTEHGSAALFSNNGKWITPKDLRPDLSPLPDAQDAVKEFEDDEDAEDTDNAADDAVDDSDNDDAFSLDDDDSDNAAVKDDSDNDDDDFGLGGDDSSKDEDNPFDEEKNDFGSVKEDDSEDDSDNPFDLE